MQLCAFLVMSPSPSAHELKKEIANPQIINREWDEKRSRTKKKTRHIKRQNNA